MPEKNKNYEVYTFGDSLTHGRSLKIEHDIVCENTEIPFLIAKGEETLQAIRQSSVQDENKAYEIVLAAVNVQQMSLMFSQQLSNTIFGLFDMMSGSAFSQATIFALSIQPYINASIIIQLLTIAIPALERLSKEGGEEGKKKLTKITRYTTVGLGVLMGFAYYVMLSNYNSQYSNMLLTSTGFLTALVIILTFTAGSTLVMWLGDQISEHGIGNGISMILFANIIARIPSGIITPIFNNLKSNMTDAIFVPNSGKHKFCRDRNAVHENGKADIVSIRRDAGIVLPCGGDRLVCALALDGALVHGLLENVHDLLHVGAVLNLKQNDLVRRTGHGGEAAADLPERNFFQSGEQGTQLRNVRDREQDRRFRAHGRDTALIERLQIAGCGGLCRSRFRRSRFRRGWLAAAGCKQTEDAGRCEEQECLFRVFHGNGLLFCFDAVSLLR